MSDSIKELATTMNDGWAEEYDDSRAYEAEAVATRHDVRRKIEDLLERKRLRDEFGDLEELDF